MGKENNPVGKVVTMAIDRDDVLGRVVHYSVLIIPSALIIFSLLFSVENSRPFGLYDHVPLGRLGIHRLTMICLCSSFLLHYLLMGYLFPLARAIIALVFVVFYIYLGAFVWTLNSYLIRGHGNIPFLIVGLVVICILLERLDDKHNILNKHNLSKWSPIIVLTLVALRLTGYVGLWQTGFWEIMELVDLSFPAGDPNRNPFWAIMKISDFGYFLPYIRRSRMKAPLRLDPRVLVW